MSLDGYISGPSGELDWATMNDDEMGKTLIDDLLETTDTMLLGRVLYQGFQDAWPNTAKDPGSPKELIEFAHWIEDSPKIVFSKTLKNVEWKNSKLISVKNDNDIVKEVAKLRKSSGGDIVLFGGTRMAQTFAELGLIDEYRFKLEPVALGSGKPLFKNRVHLRLVR